MLVLDTDTPMVDMPTPVATTPTPPEASI
jgi:hypothetical protein